MKFKDSNNKEIKEEDITRLFVYEDFLKKIIFDKGIGRLTLDNLRNETFKKIYVVPTGK